MVGWHATGEGACRAAADGTGDQGAVHSQPRRAGRTGESANAPAVTGARKVPVSRAANAPATADAPPPPWKLAGHWIVRSASDSWPPPVPGGREHVRCYDEQQSKQRKLTSEQQNATSKVARAELGEARGSRRVGPRCRGSRSRPRKAGAAQLHRGVPHFDVDTRGKSGSASHRRHRLCSSLAEEARWSGPAAAP